MKTKYILTLLALPALFAACVNDDFEQAQKPSRVESDLLAGRATGELVLTAEKNALTGDNADTRVVGDMEDADGAINWLWENANDKIGAAVVDYSKNGEIVSLKDYPDNYVITDYPFAPNIQGPSSAADFSTPTAVVEGAYMFYNRYKGFNTAERRTINHSIERILKVNAGKEAGLKQVGTAENGGQNFFISPIIDLAIKDREAIQKPISMTSAYSVLQFRLHLRYDSEDKGKYVGEKGFRVNKVVLQTLGSRDAFDQNLTLDPAAIAIIQKDLATNPAYAGWFEKNGAIKTDGVSDEQVSAALDLVNDAIADPNNEIGRNVTKKTTTDLVYQLENQFAFMSDKDVMDLLVIVPSDVYNEGKLAKGVTYEGKSEGVFLVTVYTSEGTYNTVVEAEDNLTTRTLMRGKKYNVERTMDLRKGHTNVTLFEQAKAFNIETTEDYNYTIEYIKEHSRDYGDANEWSAPTLQFVDGVKIDVDDDHFFPNFPLVYSGKNVTLNITGEASAYELNPTTVILATDENRPTINVENDGAKVTFKGDVKEGIKDFYGKEGTKDGEGYTSAFKLTSNSAIEIAAGQTVNFELLKSNKSLTIADSEAEAPAKVFVKGNPAVTAGTLYVGKNTRFDLNQALNNTANATVAEGAQLVLPTLMHGDADNDEVVMDIQGTVNVDGSQKASVNDAVINVYGKMTFTKDGGSMTNNGKLTVYGNDENEMNVGTRAEFTGFKLENNGTIKTTKSSDRKATYGGYITVETLNNNEDGVINDNGEMWVTATLANTGIIYLMEDPYALLNIKAGTSTKDGKVVLTTPAEYEMKDGYYSRANSLSDVEGPIEVTLDQATYDKVLANADDATYGTQERAWAVINRVILDGVELKLKAEMKGTNKDFILKNGATVNAQADLTLASLTTEGAGNVLNAAKANTKITIDIDADDTSKGGVVNVAEGSALTVEKNVNLIIGYETFVEDNYMLNVAGTLTNNGTIDTEDGEGGYTEDEYQGVNKLSAIVNGTLTNNWKISKPAEPKYEGEEYDKIVTLIGGLNEGAKGFCGVFGDNKPRIEKWDSNETSWVGEDAMDWNSNVTIDHVKGIIAQGEVKMVQDYAAIVGKINGVTAALYLGLPKGEEATEAYINALRDTDEFDTAYAWAVDGAPTPVLTTTWLYVYKNNGTINLKPAYENGNGGWAYGEVLDNENGIINGEFSKKR